MSCFVGVQTCKRRPDLIAAISRGNIDFRRFDQNLTIDGSLSCDPESEDNKGMNFSWHYGEIKRQNNTNHYLQLLEQNFTAVAKFKHLKVEDGGRFITFNTGFASYNGTIIVNLTVTKDYRVSSAFQIVYLVRGHPPKISLR